MRTRKIAVLSLLPHFHHLGNVVHQSPLHHRVVVHSIAYSTMMLDLGGISRLGEGVCEGAVLDEIRNSGAAFSSWISTSFENSSVTSLNGWKLTDDRNSSWKSAFLGDANSSPITSTPPPSSKATRVKYSSNNENVGSASPVVRIVKVVDRKESYKRASTSPQDAKNMRVKLVTDTRQRKKEARLLQRRAGVTNIPTTLPETSIEPFGTVVKSPSPLRVQFNLEDNKTIAIPRIDPKDKAALFYRKKEFKTMHLDEQNLFNSYHFYQEMYGLEMNVQSREALRRRMSSIANYMFGAPNTKPRRKTPKNKTKKKKSNNRLEVQELPVVQISGDTAGTVVIANEI